MKIVFVIGIMGNGGAERVIANLSNQFVKYGWDVHIITIYGSRQQYDLDDKVVLHSIKCTNKVRIFRPFERFGAIRTLIKSINPDCVISFLADVNIHVILSMLGMDTKLIVSERNDPTKDPDSRWMRWLRDRLYKRVDGIVFQTNDAMDYFASFLSSNIKKDVISNPVKANLPYYNRQTSSNEIITACRLSPQKNLPLMIDAFNSLVADGVDCKLNIYGEGPDKDVLNAYIESLGLSNKVHLCGFADDIHRRMQEACMFVISSDYEGISNSMLEALAIGIPVVATDCPVGGARMYIDDGVNGMLVPCGDCDALSHAMRYMVLNRQVAIEMGNKASLIRDELSVEKISLQWKRFIENI